MPGRSSHSAPGLGRDATVSVCSWCQSNASFKKPTGKGALLFPLPGRDRNCCESSECAVKFSREPIWAGVPLTVPPSRTRPSEAVSPLPYGVSGVCGRRVNLFKSILAGICQFCGSSQKTNFVFTPFFSSFHSGSPTGAAYRLLPSWLRAYLAFLCEDPLSRRGTSLSRLHTRCHGRPWRRSSCTPRSDAVFSFYSLTYGSISRATSHMTRVV